MLLLGMTLSSSALAAPWADAMATGDCPAVVAALPEPKIDLERLALARCLGRLGEDGKAAELAGGVTDAALAPFARLVRARALLDRDSAQAAVAATEGLSLPGVEDDLLRGRALVLAHRSAEARDGLRALLDTPSAAPEARYWLARGAEDRGDREAALTTYRAVWSKHPTTLWADRAAERLKELGAAVPDPSTETGRSTMKARADALLAAKQAVDAIPLLDALAPTLQASPGWSYALADALFDAKLYGRARDQYAAIGEIATPASLFQYALATARAGDYPSAERIYSELETRFPTSAEADEAAWKPGYMHHDAGELEAAVSGFEAYLADHPAGKFAGDAAWFRAWDLHRLHRDDDALAAMDALVARAPASEGATAARYWRARLRGDEAGLADVLQKSPDTGYAWFAAWRLHKTWPAAQEPPRPAFAKGWVEARPDVALAASLVAGGMADWARPLLGKHAGEVGNDKATALAYAWLLVDAEDYAGAKKLACPYRSEPAGLAACVVRPHRGAVTAVAAEFGLDPLLPYAIMNAESGLDPSVTSPAGAMGLMQLMPKLATTLAQDRLPGFHPSELYRAGVNARLGTTELGLLSRQWARSAVSPSLPLVIASYNGGADAVDRWLNGYASPPDVDEFAENISFTETRRYVKRVLGFLQSYRRAYGG